MDELVDKEQGNDEILVRPKEKGRHWGIKKKHYEYLLLIQTPAPVKTIIMIHTFIATNSMQCCFILTTVFMWFLILLYCQIQTVRFPVDYCDTIMDFTGMFFCHITECQHRYYTRNFI